MALEDLTGTKYLDSLVATNPVGATDPKSEGDDHIRGIKNTLLTTFPNITGAVTATHTELNILDGVTSSTAELNILTGVTSTAAELNILDTVTATATELNALDADQAATTPTVAADDSFVMDDADVGTVKVDIDNVDTYLAQTTKTLTNKSVDANNNTVTNLDASTIDFTLATGGSWAISLSSSQVIPAGLYMAVHESGSGTPYLEINQGASWRTDTQQFSGGLLLSDGTNVRLTETGGASGATVYYRQLA
jgi:hypothetical protein